MLKIFNEIRERLIENYNIIRINRIRKRVNKTLQIARAAALQINEPEKREEVLKKLSAIDSYEQMLYWELTHRRIKNENLKVRN